MFYNFFVILNNLIFYLFYYNILHTFALWKRNLTKKKY